MHVCDDWIGRSDFVETLSLIMSSSLHAYSYHQAFTPGRGLKSVPLV